MFGIILFNLLLVESPHFAETGNELAETISLRDIATTQHSYLYIC